jgi:TonB family protein
MKMWVVISLGFHLAVGGALSSRPAPTRNLIPPGKVYSVDLVSLPAARPVQTTQAATAPKTAGPEVQAAKKEPPKEDKEAIKPPAPKPKKKPKAVEPPPAETEPKEPEEKKPEEEDVSQEGGPTATVAEAAADSGEATGGVPGGATVASALGTTSTQGTVSLDVANFGFSYYLVALQAKVASNWFPPGSVGAPGEVLRATVHFRIMQSGDIEDAVVEHSSGVPYFDRCALRAILLASPLAPLPSEFEEDELGVHFEFSHTVSLR